MFEFINDEDARGQVGIGTLIVFIAMVLVAAIAAGVLINTAGVLQTQAEDTGSDSTDQVANNINVIGAVGDVNSDPNVRTLRMTVQKSPGAGDVDLGGLSIQYVGPDSFANLVHHAQFDNSNDEVAQTDGQTGFASGNHAYLVDAVTAETEDDNVMTSESDRYEIIVPLSYVPNSVTTISTDGDTGTAPATDVYSGDFSQEVKRVLPTVTADGEASGVTAGETFVKVEDVNWNNNGLSLLGESANVELTVTTESGSQRYVNLQVPDSLVGDGGGTVQL